ncbi:MAG: hypothetical protein FWD41_01925 [Actinomycetia bacterium]|nr:hypothetical protein [Actinomycetes bacterium]
MFKLSSSLIFLGLVGGFGLLIKLFTWRSLEKIDGLHAVYRSPAKSSRTTHIGS